MIVTVFRSRLMPGLQDEYVALVDRMQQIARTIPGYISHKGFWADDGERVTIVEFEHEEGQRAWRMHPEHIEAQKLGRLKYYEIYDIKVAKVTYRRAITTAKPKPPDRGLTGAHRGAIQRARGDAAMDKFTSWKASPRRCGSSMSTPT